MLRYSGLLLSTFIVAHGAVVLAQASVKEGLREASGIADDVVGRAQFIEQQFRQKSVGVEERGRKARLENGEVLFLLKDYRNAAVVLFDLVEDPVLKADPRYDDAVYFLAESLFQDGNPSAARIYFDRLVGLGASRHLTPSILRLIEIAGSRGEYDEVTKSFEAYKRHSAGRIPSQVDYYYAKALIQGGDYAAAFERLRRPAVEGPFRHQALYASGVALAALGKLRESADTFDSLLKFVPSTKVQKEIRELTHLARGRIYYELGEIGASIDAYQSIDHRSARFDEMLFEITWAYVKSAESQKVDDDKDNDYKKAVRAVEVLLASNPHSPVVPEAKVLLGNLHLRLKQYGLAEKAFDQVVKDYEPGHTELRRIIREHGDPMRYFREIIGTGIDQLSAESVLPPVAVDWAKDDDGLRIAFRLFGELHRGEKDLSEADGLVEKILSRIDGDRRINMFPTLADQQGRAVEVSALASDCERRLLDLETRILQAEGLDTKGLARLRSERLVLQRRVEKLPPTVKDRNERISGLSRRLVSLKRRLFRLTLELKGFRTTVAAVDKYVAERRKKGNLNREELGFFQINVPVIRDMIVDMERIAGRLKSEIENEESGIGAGAGSEEFALRAEFRRALEAERSASSLLRGKLTGENASDARRVEAIRGRVVGSQNQLDQVLRELETIVASEAGSLRGRVLVEQAQLEALRAEEQKLARSAELSAKGAVRDTLSNVSQKFYGIIRNADVGKVDVAWEQKENETKGITKLGRAKEREMGRIREQFDEALGSQGVGR
jgi:tetratricopeptide (TPR) repeat protein/ABC-type phosphate transport system auxiliary subunit